MPSVRVEEAPAGDRAVARLLQMARAEWQARCTDLPALSGDENDVFAPGGYMAVAWSGDEAVACGALRALDAAAAEIRGVFVVPFARGCGIARHVLAHLEAEARTRGHARVDVCAGRACSEAAGLYRSLRYDEATSETSAVHVCFTKSLSAAPERSVWRWPRRTSNPRPFQSR